MASKGKYKANAPLQKGDKVICLKMEDEFSPVPGGTPGVVKSVSDVFGQTQYYVQWKSGSSLALIDGVDKWAKIVDQDDDETEQENLAESVMFFTTKRAIIKEIKK